MSLQWIAICPELCSIFLFRKKNSTIRAPLMVGYEKVVDVLLAFKVVCLSIVAYNKQDLRYIMMKLVRTIGKHVPPHSVEHQGALTGTLNIMAQYNTTPKSLKSVLLLRGPSPVVDWGAGHHERTFTKVASWTLSLNRTWNGGIWCSCKTTGEINVAEKKRIC